MDSSSSLPAALNVSDQQDDTPNVPEDSSLETSESEKATAVVAPKNPKDSKKRAGTKTSAKQEKPKKPVVPKKVATAKKSAALKTPEVPVKTADAAQKTSLPASKIAPTSRKRSNPVPQDGKKITQGKKPRSSEPANLNVTSADSDLPSVRSVMEEAARRYNLNLAKAHLGEDIRISLHEFDDEGRDVEDETDHLFPDLSLREDNARLTRDNEYLRSALAIFEQRDASMRRLVTGLNEEYVLYSPSNYTVGCYRSYRYLHEKLELEVRLHDSRIPGGFRSLYAWDQSWEVPFKASQKTPYLAIRNGRLPVRPNAAYVKFPMGTVFQEFVAVEVIAAVDIFILADYKLNLSFLFDPGNDLGRLGQGGALVDFHHVGFGDFGR
jgi:hypothetical protein